MECLPRLERRAATRLLPAIQGFLPHPTGAPTCASSPSLRDCGRALPGRAAGAPGRRAGRRSRCFFADAVPFPDGYVAHALMWVRSTAGPASSSTRDLVHDYGREGEWGLAPAPGLPRARRVDLRLPVARRSRSSGRADRARRRWGVVGRPDRADGGLHAVRRRSYPRRCRTGPAPCAGVSRWCSRIPTEHWNARRTILDAVARPLELFGLADGVSRRARAGDSSGGRAGERYPDLYPGQVSGGERQRVAIGARVRSAARSRRVREPTSALDVSVQATVLELLVELQARPERPTCSYPTTCRRCATSPTT